MSPAGRLATLAALLGVGHSLDSPSERGGRKAARTEEERQRRQAAAEAKRERRRQRRLKETDR